MTVLIKSETEIKDIEVKAALDVAVEKVYKNLPHFTYCSQNHSSVDGIYPQVENNQWTCGFWPGSIWLAYEHSRDKRFRYAGQIQVQSFLHRIKNRIDTDHHDMGFLFTPSCVSAWKLVGDEDARDAAILAADQLLDRYQPLGEFIQAWGDMNEPGNYRYIIDALMNLPLLYWATDITGNEEYVEVARKHAATTMRHSIRSDDSTYHSFLMDPKTGAPVKGMAVQGYKDESAWARGQAWAVYGMALLYRLEGDDQYLDAFDRVLTYFLNRLPEDLIPYWDLSFTEGDEPRDSSSSVIVVCGLLEMSKLVDEDRGRDYAAMARRMMKSVVERCSVGVSDPCNGLLQHGTYSKNSPFNSCTEEGVDECLSWGDYFYMEALTRLSRNWNAYWF